MRKRQIWPIETRYNGYRFRSRLEARWAVFFDTIRLKYEFESEGYNLGSLGPYLPDFWFPQIRMFGEAKAIHDVVGQDRAITQCIELCRLTKFGTLFLFGVPSYLGLWGVEILSEFQPSESNSFAFTMERYWESEGRMFAGTGCEGPWPLPFPYYENEARQILHDPITAARSARFEHGESP